MRLHKNNFGELERSVDINAGKDWLEQCEKTYGDLAFEEPIRFFQFKYVAIDGKKVLGFSNKLEKYKKETNGRLVVYFTRKNGVYERRKKFENIALLLRGE